MSYLKTKENNEDVFEYLNVLGDEVKKNDCFQILEMMQSITSIEPKMWGKRMIGFGSYKYKTKAGKIGEWFMIGFSPTKENISLHLMFGLEQETKLLSKLGKHKTGKGCLYIKKLADVDTSILKEIMKSTYENMNNNITKI